MVNYTKKFAKNFEIPGRLRHDVIRPNVFKALGNVKGKTQYDLAEEVRKMYFVERVDIVSGHTDLLAIVRVKDVEEFDKVLLGKLQIIEGVDKTESLIVIHGK